MGRAWANSCGAAALAALAASAASAAGAINEAAEDAGSALQAAMDPCDQHMDQDLGWLQKYIEVGFFADFRRQAWRYYERNETTYAFLWFNSITYANLDFVREACPQAARLALLLRAEERLPAREAESPLLEYAALTIEETAGEATLARNEEARPSQPDSGAWPLAAAVDRLRRLTVQMASPEEYTVDVVMPYCDEPLDGLLSRATGYEDEWLSSRVPFRHASLFLYRLEVCMPGAEGASISALPLTGEEALASLPPRAAEAAKQFRSVEVVPVDASPQAWEAARYLLHFTTRYDHLADFTLFLHPDVFEHVNPRTLRNVLQSLRVGSFRQSGLGAGVESAVGGRDDHWYDYLSLSHHYLTRPSRVSAPSTNCTLAELGFGDLHRSVFGGEGAEAGGVEVVLGDFGFYCCSQFLVHRDRVHRRPREWYRRVAETVPWEHCATSYMELLWHGIFHGGRLHEQKRQERADLPLFLRVDNFVESTADGLV